MVKYHNCKHFAASRYVILLFSQANLHYLSQLPLPPRGFRFIFWTFGKQTLKLWIFLGVPVGVRSWTATHGLHAGYRMVWWSDFSAENQSRVTGWALCSVCSYIPFFSVFPIVPRCYYPHPARCTSEAGGFRKWVLVTTPKTTRSRKDASRDTLCFAWTPKSELCCSETTPIPADSIT